MRWATLVAVAVAVVATAVVVRTQPDLALAGPSPAVLALELFAAGLAAAAGIAMRRPLFAVAAAAWLVAEWASPGAGMLFTAGLVLAAAWPAVLAAAVSRRLAVAGLLLTAGVLGLAGAAVSDPRAAGCAACPADLLLVHDAPDLAATLARTGLAAAVAWAAAVVAFAALALLRATPARRHAEAPVVIPVAVAIGLFAADAAHGIARGFLAADPTDRALRAAEALAFTALAVGLLLEPHRLRRTRDRVAQLVLDVGAAPAPGRLRARLAATLGDQQLVLLHPVDGGWIDEDGRPAVLPRGDGRTVTQLRVAGEPVLAVVHRAGLLDDPQLVDELATTARLAIDHERLQAAHRARLADLRASRERIVAAADQERRRLERDLHDGAQQRLVTLALALRLARRRHPGGDDPALAAAEEHVRAATADLREVAHGLFPTVLADEGLRAALEVLSERSPRLVARHLPDGRFPEPAESAAYFAAREALRVTGREVSVDGIAEEGCLRLRIAVDGAFDGALTPIEDRVGAAGGRVEAQDGQLLLELPCGS